MDENLSKAFLVLFVGMFTVFVILLLVVLSGKALILIINKYFPLPEKEIIPEASNYRSASTPLLNKISPKKLAAIVSAVEVLTFGKGKVTDVEKL